MLISRSARSRAYFTRSVVALAAWLAVPHAGAVDVDLVIRDVRIISGASPQASAPTDVAIGNNRIVRIGKYRDTAKREIDAKGQYLIPGLIDTHVHLGSVPGFNGDPQQYKAMLEVANRQIPRSYLYFGFTTLLDLASGPETMPRWNEYSIAPTTMYCAPVTIPNGYPLAWMDEQQQFHASNLRYMLFDERQADKYPADFEPKQHSPAALVENVVADGAACVKFFHETGFGRLKDLPVPTTALARELVAAAHEKDLPVFLHGNSEASYEFGMAVGVDAMVHGMWHWDDLALDRVDEIDEFARDFANGNIAVQPTVQVVFGEKELFNPRFFDDARFRAAVPADLLDWYQSDAAQWMKREIGKAFPTSEDPEALYRVVANGYAKPIDQVLKMSNAIARQGGQLLFGSDTPSGPIYTQFPGINGRWEMDRWIEAGLSPEELFVAMTIDNARVLGKADEIGSIEVGTQADLLLLQDNPLQDIKAYDSISIIILDGKVIQRESLAAH